MAEALVPIAVETISKFISEEVKFLSGVKDQVQGLHNELEVLGSFLKDANARKHENETVLKWVRQATRLAYRAEDIIEEYAIKVESKRGCGFKRVARRVACIVGEGISTHDVGNEIANIKTEMTNLITSLESYGIRSIIAAPPSQETLDKQRRLRTTYAHKEEEYFVGMEDDVSKIVTWVTENDNLHRVISICGVGGLGKTTIARKVFNHRQVQLSFECFAWESVTQQCQVEELLQNILIQILGHGIRDEIRKMKEKDLVPMLYKELKNKKCFVVLDDIWKRDDWESLLPAFPNSEGSSKILLTTRIREVAEVAHRDSQHEPTLLDEKEGWDLLTKIAFNLQEDQVDKLLENVEGIGRDMLRKCGGLPLAITAIGGILRNTDPMTEWEDVNKKFGMHMSENGGILEVLAFSYYDLPSYLKPCFLFMGCFREDEEIDCIHLYQLWMAEGLIPSSMQESGESLMDAASKVLDKLISRNMVQSQTKNIYTAKKSCRLHDLVRDLCLTKGKEEEFMKFESKQFIGTGEAWVIRYDGLDLCRKSIFIDITSEDHKWRGSVEISGHNTYIRTLMITCSKWFGGPELKFNGPRFNFKRLRSLVLDRCRFKNNKLPKEIRDMIHLRYLSLQYSLQGEQDGILPAFIGDLQYLQTLNLAHNQNLQLPNIFHKMKRLRCLYLPKYREQSMFGRRLEFHGLNELEVVEGLDTKYDEFTLQELVNLRRFGATIRGYENLSLILGQLSSLLKVQYVSIIFKKEDYSGSVLEQSAIKKLLLCRHLHELQLWAPIREFPRYESQVFWPDLVSLDLRRTKFSEDPMPFLQELPNLRDLNIFDEAYVGKEMYCSSKAFPKLTSLILHGLKNIEIWTVDAGAFPNLSYLQIDFCNSFEIVPHGLTNITSLTKIDIDEDMPEEFRIKYGSLQRTNHL